MDLRVWLGYCLAPLPNTAPLPGRIFGRYELQELIAVSGMGVVYQAWNPALECLVAVKLVSEDTIPDESARRQLEAEARIASSLNHTNICKIKDVLEESGQANDSDGTARVSSVCSEQQRRSSLSPPALQLFAPDEPPSRLQNDEWSHHEFQEQV